MGLPDDELHRRIGVHRGVYGRYRDVVPNERALYHLVPARWFNAQLPIGAGRDGYVTEDFHVLGGIEMFRDLDKLLAHANEQLAERRGYFYVMQLDFDRPEAKTFRRDETRVSSRREKTEEKKKRRRVHVRECGDDANGWLGLGRLGLESLRGFVRDGTGSTSRVSHVSSLDPGTGPRDGNGLRARRGGRGLRPTRVRRVALGGGVDGRGVHERLAAVNEPSRHLNEPPRRLCGANRSVRDARTKTIPVSRSGSGIETRDV